MAIDYSKFPIPKGNRHAQKVERLAKRRRIENEEDVEKRKAKKRDGWRCCWPHATREERDLCQVSRLEAAHWKAKGMGGDHGARSKAENLISFCLDTHQGPRLSLHAGTRKVEPLDPAKKMNGPRAFYEKRGGKWIEVGREISPGLLMTKRP